MRPQAQAPTGAPQRPITNPFEDGWKAPETNPFAEGWKPPKSNNPFDDDK